jgi:hypothetical protein
MDFSSLMSSGSGGGGGGSNWGKGLQIGGMAEQDIAGYLSAWLSEKDQERALDQAKAEVEPAYTQAAGYLQPYADENFSNYSTLKGLVQSGAFDTAPMNYSNSEQQPLYTEQPFNFEEDPGYQFRLQEGTNAIQNTAAARGSLLSGATLKAIQRYGSNLASQEYQQAFDRYNTNRQAAQNMYGTNLNQFNANRSFGYNTALNNWNQQAGQNQNRYNQYASLSNYGSEAPGALSNLALQRGETLANLDLSRGNVRAAGWQAAGNAAIGQGQHLAEIGGGMQSSSQSQPTNANAYQTQPIQYQPVYNGYDNSFFGNQPRYDTQSI